MVEHGGDRTERARRGECLDQRMPNLSHLTTRLRRAWEAPRNAAGGTVNWRSNAVDARIRLKHLYPIHE